MGNEYTPTTEDVREMYKSGAWLRADDQESAWKPEVYAPRYYAEFDRWLAAHDERLLADERERIAQVINGMITRTEMPYWEGWDDAIRRARGIARQGGSDER